MAAFELQGQFILVIAVRIREVGNGDFFGSKAACVFTEFF